MEQEGRDVDAGDDPTVEQVTDSRFDWVTGVNDGIYYYSQYWLQRAIRGIENKKAFCVVKRYDNKLYYVSDCDDTNGVNDEGPFNSLTDAAAVCVMRNYGNET
jgi:hypothetical protein